MLDFCIETYRNAFAWIFDVWNRIDFGDGVTIWSLIIAAYLSFGLVAVIVNRFGGSITTEVSDAYKAQKYRDEARAKAAAKAAKKAEKNNSKKGS